MKKISIFLISYLVPLAAYAQTADPKIKLQNPLKANSFEGFFRNVLSDVILPVSAIIGVVLIIWAGFKFVTSQGEPAKLSEAKKRLIYTLIGVGIVIASEVILDLLLNTIKELKV